MSNFGKNLSNFEKFLKNLRIFILRNQKFIEILFLLFYGILQITIALIVKEFIVTLVVMFLLLGLTLERIFVQLGSEYKEELYKNELSKIKMILSKMNYTTKKK